MGVLFYSALWIDMLVWYYWHLVALLRQGRVATHDHIIGEVAMGSVRNRDAVLDSLLDLPRAPLAEEAEVRSFVENRRLVSRGIGYSDAHILASIFLQGGLALWTRDRRLADVARELGVAYAEAS